MLVENVYGVHFRLTQMHDRAGGEYHGHVRDYAQADHECGGGRAFLSGVTIPQRSYTEMLTKTASMWVH